MAFCPFYDKQCPETGTGDAGCAIWTDFGCCMIDKPGTPGIYTDGEEDPVDVYIIEIKVNDADLQTEFLIIYALISDGTILLEDDITKFAVHLM